MPHRQKVRHVRFEIVVPLLGVVVRLTLRCLAEFHVCSPHGVIGVHATSKARINEPVISVARGARVFFGVCNWVEWAVPEHVVHHIVEQ